MEEDLVAWVRRIQADLASLYDALEEDNEATCAAWVMLIRSNLEAVQQRLTRSRASDG